MYTLLIAFFLVSIIFSFLCSLWEAVLLSVTPSYAEIEYQKGSRTGHHLRQFKENIDRPLAAILTLNTIAHTVGAIGVGAQATIIWADANPLITGLVVPATMTLAILILSEIIPKTIGATHWPQLARFTVKSLLVVITALYPLVWLSQFITNVMKRDAEGSIYSRGDFVAMAEIGARTGVFDPGESKIIENLIRFNEITAHHIMTPRTVVTTASGDTTIQDFLEAVGELQFSRIPIYAPDSPDTILGYVLKNELLGALVDNRGHEPLSSLCREIITISHDFPLPALLNRFIEGREHIALVERFGGMAGIVTIEDVIETLLGLEIVDESDAEVDMQRLARANWEERARRHGLLVNADAQDPQATQDPESP